MLRHISQIQVLLAMALVVALYFFTAFAGDLIATHRIDAQVNDLSAQISALRERNEQLRADAAVSRSDAFVERQARDRLGLTRAGDVAVVVANAPTPLPPPPAAAPLPPPHWQNWARVLGLR